MKAKSTKFRSKIVPGGAGKIVVLASVGVLLGAPAAVEAQGFDMMLRQYLGSSKATNNPATQNLIRQNISTRQAQIESEITAGVTAGKLTRQEENDLRSELNRIELQEGQFLSDGNLDNNETQILVDALTRLTQRMQSYMANTANVGTGGISNNAWFNRYGGPKNSGNQIERQARLDTRRSQLSSKIQQGILTGQLTQRESSRLQTQLNNIANMENQMLADARLGYNEQQQLLSALDSLDQQINQELNDVNYGGRRNRWGGGGGGGWNPNDPGFNRDQSLIRQRINMGLASGKLKQWEANILLSKEQQISQIQTRLATAGATLSFNEGRQLNDQMQQLSRDINQMLSQKQVW